MAQYTTNDLAVRVLRDLNIIDAEETPSAEDLAYTIETIQSEFARMEADGIKFSQHSTSVNSINIVLYTELSRRMGFAIGPAFGIMDAATGEAGKAASEGVLRRLVAPVKTPEVLTIERAARGTKIRDPIISQ
jgi:hypothetical protein